MHLLSPSSNAQDEKPLLTRADQVNRKGERPGRGRGRGGGRGRGRGDTKAAENKSDEVWMENDWNDPNWHYSDDFGWYWEKQKDTEEKNPKPSKKQKGAEEAEHDTTAKKSKRKGKDKDEKEQAHAAKKSKTKDAGKTEPAASSSNGNEPKKRPAASEKAAKTTKKQKKAKNEDPQPMHPAPMTRKDEKKEIHDFLVECKDFTDDNAKENLKQMLHSNFRNPNFEFRMNIYWVRKGVWGAGVGLKSLKENKDFAFYGYKTWCDSWIYATAAAIKSSEILASFTHICFIARACFLLHIQLTS